MELALKGYKVVGIDLSQKMVDEARSRAARQGVNVEFHQSSFENLSSVAGEQFDLVLSNFGGLNCVESLEKVATQVASVTKPGGHFIAVVMPRVSLWEIVAGISRFNLSFAFRRFTTDTPATGFHGRTFRVSYYSPRQFTSAFRQSFYVAEIRGLNIITPPPQATRFKAKNPRLSSLLEQCDEILGSFPILRSMGDHSLIVLKKKQST